MGLEEFKKRYNEILAREKKAEVFFENPEISQERKEKWLPKFNEITMELSKMMKHYKELTGTEMKDNEIFNGFKN
jgi:poly(A) polymerase Pap1